MLNNRIYQADNPVLTCQLNRLKDSDSGKEENYNKIREIQRQIAKNIDITKLKSIENKANCAAVDIVKVTDMSENRNYYFMRIKS